MTELGFVVHISVVCLCVCILCLFVSYCMVVVIL